MARRITEICIYALLFAALALCALSPLLSLLVLPFAAALLVYLYARFSYPLPLCVWAAYAAASLLLRFDAINAVGSLILLITFLALTRVLRQKNWFIAAVTAALSATLALCLGLSIVCGVTRLSPPALAAEYAQNTDGVLLDAFAEYHYNRLDDDALDSPRIEKGEEGYSAEVRRVYATAIRAEADESIYWLSSGWALVMGVASYLVSLLLLRYSSKQEKIEQAAHRPKITLPQEKISEMRLNRTYLIMAFLPALAFMLFLFVEGMQPFTRAVFNFLALVPLAISGVTLLLHTALRFGKKAGVAAKIVFALMLAAAVFFFDLGVILFALLGFADALINVRKMLDYALS